MGPDGALVVVVVGGGGEVEVVGGGADDVVRGGLDEVVGGLFDTLVDVGTVDEEEFLDVEVVNVEPPVPIPIPLPYPLVPQAVAVTAADWLASSTDGAWAMRSSSKLSWAVYQASVKGVSSFNESGTTDPVMVEAVDPVVAVPEHVVIVVQTCEQLEVAVLPPPTDTAHEFVQ